MTAIDIGSGDDARDGLMTLIVSIVEILVETLEREAIRRMESSNLTDEEIDRLGRQLATIGTEIDQIKRNEWIEDSVDDLRGDLDGLVTDAIERLDVDLAKHRKPGYSVFGGEGE